VAEADGKLELDVMSRPEAMDSAPDVGIVDDEVEAMIREGNIDGFFSPIHDEDETMQLALVACAAKNDSVKVLDSFYANSYKFPDIAFHLACVNNSLDAVKWLWQRGLYNNSSPYRNALFNSQGFLQGRLRDWWRTEGPGSELTPPIIRFRLTVPLELVSDEMRRQASMCHPDGWFAGCGSLLHINVRTGYYSLHTNVVVKVSCLPWTEAETLLDSVCQRLGVADKGAVEVLQLTEEEERLFDVSDKAELVLDDAEIKEGLASEEFKKAQEVADAAADALAKASEAVAVAREAAGKAALERPTKKARKD
jgi:hypothetical protein